MLLEQRQVKYESVYAPGTIVSNAAITRQRQILATLRLIIQLSVWKKIHNTP